VSIGQSNLTLLSGNLISISSISDLDQRHLGCNPKLSLDISYLHTKFCVNRPKQTKVFERKPKVDARPPDRRLRHYNFPVFVENLVKKSGCHDGNQMYYTLPDKNQQFVLWPKQEIDIALSTFLIRWKKMFISTIKLILESKILKMLRFDNSITIRIFTATPFD
jgi:hypothetical protein